MECPRGSMKQQKWVEKVYEEGLKGKESPRPVAFSHWQSCGTQGMIVGTTVQARSRFLRFSKKQGQATRWSNFTSLQMKRI
eukprot:5651901-Prorocentrum_lima.AAC.1